MKIDKSKVAERYNQMSAVWSTKDKWHYRTFRVIKEFVIANVDCNNNSVILNAGSGGNDYGISVGKMIHIDIAKERIINEEHFIIGSIENIPIPSSTISHIICVGSVINYCDPIPVISEFQRILKNDGVLILEFENSKTFELIGNKMYNKKSTLVKSFYDNQEEIIWYFSEKFITELLELSKFRTTRILRFHILSAFVYKLTRNPNLSSYFAKVDQILRYFPFLRTNSSNVILKAKLSK